MLSPVEGWIDKILALQSSGRSEVPAGLFPTYRSNPMLRYHRLDISVFFSAITAFTLQSLSDTRPGDGLHEKISRIIDGVVRNYPDFRNKDGLATYNFWKTRPSGHFRNGYVFYRFEHFRIPDDVDDTAMVYLTTHPSDEETSWLKDKLSVHANGSQYWIRNTYPEYRPLRAYSTWFGKKMYIEFDVCVLSNLLYCICRYDLAFNQHDWDSLTYIRSVIESGRYLTEPFRCAHQYPRPALIVYHVARLIHAFDPERLRPIRAQLVKDACVLLAGAHHPMDRIILSTSLLRLGEAPAYLPTAEFTKRDFDGFYFFIAGLMTAYEHPVLYRIAESPLFHMYWTCEAHCWALLAEYEIYHQRSISEQV